jgi:enhancer of mRNA-decapping protein 4
VAGLSDERAQKKQQDALSAAVAKETKKAVESELRRALEAKSFKDDVAAAIAQSVQSELLSVVAAKVKDTVRETVKSSLSSAFRTSFESSLLPAFQAGTDRMFMQLQASFEQGLEGLVEQDRERAEETRATAQLVALLKDEVFALRAVVSSLEARIAAGGAVGAAAAATAPQDPLELLQRGMVEPALEAALEHKDTEVLVRVLGQLSPSQVTEKCSVLVLLCTTQQLAVDLATTVDPIEVGSCLLCPWVLLPKPPILTLTPTLT